MSEAENVQREARSLRAQEMKPAGPLTSLVASAKRITSKNLTGGSAARRSGDQKASWQEDAWEMYDLVGEQRFLASTLAGRLAQAKLFVGTLNPESPSDDPTPLENSKINDVLQAFGNSQAGRTQLLRRQAVNLFVAGDGWFVGIPPKLLHPEVEADEDGTFKPYPRGGTKSKASDDDDDEFDLGSVRLDDLEWRMLSVSEVSTSASTGKVKLKVLEGGQDLEVSPDDVYLIQVWRPHPRRWWEADSPTRASLPVLKELVGLTMHVSAQVDSRLAGAGILVVPASAQRALQVAAGQTDENATDQFTEALMEAMLTPIADRSNASAVVPLVVTVPDETVDKFQYISFATHLDSEARALRDEAIRRLALGQDAPPELLLGTSGMNHWGAWLTQEDTVTTHIEPPLALICDALTTQYLWPVLEQMGVEDHENYVIWYDVRHMISRPTIGTDALALHERDAISDDALRRTMGFDDEDAPEKQDDSDRVAEIVLAMVQANPALISRPGLRVLIEQLTAVVRGEVPPVYDPHGSQKPVDGIDEEEEQQTPKPAAGAPTAEDQPTAAEMSPGNPPTHIGPAEVPAA